MNLIVIIIISLILSAFFSGMEIAFVSANKLRIELDKKQGYLPSKIITIFIKNPGQYIATMLVGNNIALVIYGIVMAISLEPMILLFVSADASLLIIQTIISTAIILVTAEFLPKALFRGNPNAFLNIFSVPVFIFYILLYPITKITIGFTDFFLKHFLKLNRNSMSNKVLFGKVDLDHFVNELQNAKTTDTQNENEIKIFQNALDFSKVKLRDCMVPRTEIEALEINFNVKDLEQKFVETGYSKIIIYKDNIDNIIGYINSKELFKSPSDIKSKIVRPAIFPETMAASKLLKVFMQEHQSLALVVDEFGGTSGIVTIEDIIEEIFGEIEDEHDTIDFIEKKISEAEFIFSGRLEIDYLNEKYNLNIPVSDEYETIAGFILYHYQSLPEINQKIEIYPFSFRILKMDNTRLELVNLRIAGNLSN